MSSNFQSQFQTKFAVLPIERQTRTFLFSKEALDFSVRLETVLNGANVVQKFHVRFEAHESTTSDFPLGLAHQLGGYGRLRQANPRRLFDGRAQSAHQLLQISNENEKFFALN